MDEQVISWATQHPTDWQAVGDCAVYMWGSGGHHELGEGISASKSPVKVPSFSQAAQVISNFFTDPIIYIHAILLSCVAEVVIFADELMLVRLINAGIGTDCLINQSIFALSILLYCICFRWCVARIAHSWWTHLVT